MATYAHIRGGRVLDPREADSVDAYKALFSDGQLTEWAGDTFKAVTDGTKHGATDNGDGSFPNPPTASVPQVLSKTAFMDVATAALGGGQAGRGRFQEIIEAARDFVGNTAAAREVRFVYERYAAATSFNKTNVQALTTILQAAGIMSAGEASALIAAWPAA